MIPLDDALAEVTTLGLDTSPIIYLIETHPEYDVLVTEIFRRIDQGIIIGFTSAIDRSFIDLCKYKGMFYSLSCAYLKKPRIRLLS